MKAEKYGIMPIANYWMSSDFGGKHSGIDIGWKTEYGYKQEVWAWKSGVVVASYYDSAMARGNTITIRHDNGDGTYQYTNYLHLEERKVNVGEEVKQGQVIGIRGGTPNYGPHLHFTVSQITNNSGYNTQWAANNPVDPKSCTYKAKDKAYEFNETMNWLKDMPEDDDKDKEIARLNSIIDEAIAVLSKSK